MTFSSRDRHSGHIAGARTLSQLNLFPSVKSTPEVASPREGAISDEWASPRKSAGNATHATKAGKLKLSESGAGGRKSWTIRTSRQSGEALRVRRSDAGYAVTLRFRDQSEELREPYLCYLTADEWGEARQGSLSQIVSLVGEKMRRRQLAPELAELISRLEAAAMMGLKGETPDDRAS